MIYTVLIMFSLSSFQKIHKIVVEVSAEIDKINFDLIKYYTCLIQANSIELIKVLQLIFFDFQIECNFHALLRRKRRIFKAKCRKVFMPIRRDDLNSQASPQVVVFAAQLIKALPPFLPNLILQISGK